MDRLERARLHEAMTRLAAGDRDAFQAVYDRAWPEVRGLALRLLRDPVAAEDAAQDALLKVFERASVFDPERDALPWILGTAAWECRTARTRGRRRKEVALEPLIAPGPTPEEAVVAADLRAALEVALGALTPSDLATLEAAAGGPRPAIGAAAFRKRLQRARSRLRAAWRATHDAG